MKKVLKSTLLLLIVSVIMFTLTGCGNNEKSKDSKDDKTSSNKDTLVATKTYNDAGIEYEQTVEVEFKDNLANKVTMTMEFDDEETAKLLAEYLKEEEGFRQDGKKVVYEMNVEDYAEENDISKDELTKEFFKTTFEEEGYTIK